MLGRICKPEVDLRVDDNASRGLCVGGFACWRPQYESRPGGDRGGENIAS
jgi:hypothetical protein